MSIRVTLNITEEITDNPGFDMTETAEAVCRETLEMEQCPADAEVSLTYVGEERIHSINRQFRGIDSATDVLSFPNINLRIQKTGDSGEKPDWDKVLADPEQKAECMDPETGNLFLGDIVLNLDRVHTQASEYGHSVQREFAFLIAHSMLHLCGYDHMTEEEADIMFAKQEQVLNRLGITRNGGQ